MIEAFTTWYEKHKATFDMENQIIADKLSQGINGIEWLVLQTEVNNGNSEKLKYWLELISDIEGKNAEDVMKDALQMNHEDFYKKHELNWWISVKDTLTYLRLMKERKYDRYFMFIQKLNIRENEYDN